MAKLGSNDSNLRKGFLPKGMDNELLEILVDPISKVPLRLEVQECDASGNVVHGMLHGSSRSYPIIRGIPRFGMTVDDRQIQTSNSFDFKWHQRNTYDAPEMKSQSQEWLVRRYGFDRVEAMQEYFASRSRILDAGCGAGFSASLWMDESWTRDNPVLWYGVDISEAIDVARERLGLLKNTHFLQADILQLPFSENTFDIVFSEGVLHHTPSTENALKALASLVKQGGEIMFYVYRKKAPAREFTDDYVRSIISKLPPQEAWRALRPLTRLAQALAELHSQVEIPEDIPYLEIKAGRYNVQRLVYWFFAKLFWNEAFTFEQNNHVNFDWYHPQYAHRHTEEEIRRWCKEIGLAITHFDIQFSGFTVRAIRR